jgi:hypothetical protein
MLSDTPAHQIFSLHSGPSGQITTAPNRLCTLII